MNVAKRSAVSMFICFLLPQVITTFDGAAATRRVSFQYTTFWACTPGSLAPRCKADWEAFLDWLGKKMSTNPPKGLWTRQRIDSAHLSASFHLSFLPTEIAAKIRNNQTISIAIISHGVMMRAQILKSPSTSVYNDQGFSGTFFFNSTTSKVTQTGGWINITQSLDKGGVCDAATGLPAADYARCGKKYPQVWAELAAKNCLA